MGFFKKEEEADEHLGGTRVACPDCGAVTDTAAQPRCRVCSRLLVALSPEGADVDLGGRPAPAPGPSGDPPPPTVGVDPAEPFDPDALFATMRDADDRTDPPPPPPPDRERSDP